MRSTSTLDELRDAVDYFRVRVRSCGWLACVERGWLRRSRCSMPAAAASAIDGDSSGAALEADRAMGRGLLGKCRPVLSLGIGLLPRNSRAARAAPAT